MPRAWKVKDDVLIGTREGYLARRTDDNQNTGDVMVTRWLVKFEDGGTLESVTEEQLDAMGAVVSTSTENFPFEQGMVAKILLRTAGTPMLYVVRGMEHWCEFDANNNYATERFVFTDKEMRVAVANGSAFIVVVTEVYPNDTAAPLANLVETAKQLSVEARSLSAAESFAYRLALADLLSVVTNTDKEEASWAINGYNVYRRGGPCNEGVLCTLTVGHDGPHRVEGRVGY